MIFLAHVETWDEFEKDFIQSRVVFAAEGYVDATEKLVYHFGNDMEAIHLLTAISDNNMIYIDETAEDIIKAMDENGF